MDTCRGTLADMNTDTHSQSLAAVSHHIRSSVAAVAAYFLSFVSHFVCNFSSIYYLTLGNISVIGYVRMKNRTLRSDFYILPEAVYKHLIHIRCANFLRTGHTIKTP